MKTVVGVWLDQREVHVVSITDGKETFSSLESDVESRLRPAGGSRSRTVYGPQDVASERKREEKRGHHLRKYYASVARIIGEPDLIFIFGPGEAKPDLAKELKRSKVLETRIAGVESADKMTKGQIAARVRGFLGR